MTQATNVIQTRWLEIKKIWTDNRWLYVIAGILIGILTAPAIEQITGDLNTLIGNLVPETIGIIFTVLILNRAADNRAQAELRKQLLAELRSSSTSPAVNALDRLRHEGWLEDDYFISNEGSVLLRANWEGAYIGNLNFQNADLRGANFKGVVVVNKNGIQKTSFKNADMWGIQLQGSNLKEVQLQGADLTKANLEHAILWGANLEGAYLQGAQLDKAMWADPFGIVKTILPDGMPWSAEEDNQIERFTNALHPRYWETMKAVDAIRSKLGYDLIEQ